MDCCELLKGAFSMQLSNAAVNVVCSFHFWWPSRTIRQNIAKTTMPATLTIARAAWSFRIISLWFLIKCLYFFLYCSDDYRLIESCFHLILFDLYRCSVKQTPFILFFCYAITFSIIFCICSLPIVVSASTCQFSNPAKLIACALYNFAGLR